MSTIYWIWLYSFLLWDSGNYSCAGPLAQGTNDAATAFSGGVASGKNSVAFAYGNTRFITSLFAPASITDTAKCQLNFLNIGIQTENATPKRLTSFSGIADATNVFVLDNNSSATFSGLVTASTTEAGDGSSWEIKSEIMRAANPASTVLIGTPTITLLGATADASTWIISVSADITLGAINVTFTGQTGKTIRVNCALSIAETNF